ncbi:MAG: glycosyltransferase family 9 protein [Verrucomicrobiota bacterium]|nr:glycosyltransferase family 9 protein [Verrucomicrobiota bacterium]
MKRFFLRNFLRLILLCRSGKRPPLICPTDRYPKILIIRRNRMGDMVCTLPMIRQIRKHFPKAWIRVLADREGELMASASGLCDEIIILEKEGGRYAQIIQNAKYACGFDYSFAVKVGFDSLAASLAFLSGARRRMGFVNENDPDLRERFLYTDPVEVPLEKEHQAVSCMRLLLPMAIPEGPYDFSIKVSPEYEEFANQALSGFHLEEKGFALVSVSTNQEDHWSVQNFSALCQCIRSELGFSVVITSTPSDRGIARDLVTLCDHDSICSIDTPGVLHLAAIIGKARFVIAFEGGLAHLTTACGIPGVILWRKNAPFEKWKALSSKHHYVRGEPVSDISVSEVLHAARHVIDENSL